MNCSMIRRFGIMLSLGATTLFPLWVSTLASATDQPAMINASDAASTTQADDAASFIEFILEDEANCQSRESQHVIVHSIHPKRTIRVWLDRYYRNVPTGDRSRTDLPPGAEPEGLGCATIMNAKQEWRVVRAVFLD